MTPGNPILDTFIKLLAGTPANAAPMLAGTSRGGPPPGPPPAPMMLPAFPQEMMPPPQRPVSEPATLPGGSFAPAAAMQPSAPVEAGNPLMALFGGKDIGQMIRAFGAGAGAGTGGRGDPFEAFGRGFGGATQHYDVRDELDARAAAAGEEQQYDRSMAEEKMKREAERDARDFELRKVADARAGKTADLNNEKTMMEIRREARMNGVSISQQLEIERIAQASAENIYDPTERKRMVDETRERLIREIGGGQSLSGTPTLSNTAEITATGPNGEKMVVRDGAWVPM